MDRYYLGVDVGGTKSLAWLCDSVGSVLGTGIAGDGTRHGDDYSQMREVLIDITTQALRSACVAKADIASACFGISGYDWPSQRQAHLDVIAQIGLVAQIALVNDALLVLNAGSESGAGVALIAGTYCNCRGQMIDGRSGRAIGEGHLFGEGAGAGELVWHARHAVAAAWTMAGPPTLLTEKFIAYTNAASADDLIEGLVTRHYTIKPDAAPLVLEAARAGDMVAQGLVRWAAEALASMACAVVQQMAATEEVLDMVLGGSFFKAGTMLTEPMKSAIWSKVPRARFVEVTVPPVVGAVLLALRQSCLPDDEIAAARAHLLSQS
jgi:N-acetylglucosamine kinase-like BadF-type ATPase